MVPSPAMVTLADGFVRYGMRRICHRRLTESCLFAENAAECVALAEIAIEKRAAAQKMTVSQ
jgi:hypothetical protein